MTWHTHLTLSRRIAFPSLQTTSHERERDRLPFINWSKLEHEREREREREGALFNSARRARRERYARVLGAGYVNVGDGVLALA